jgi:hypothetical protein
MTTHDDALPSDDELRDAFWTGHAAAAWGEKEVSGMRACAALAVAKMNEHTALAARAGEPVAWIAVTERLPANPEWHTGDGPTPDEWVMVYSDTHDWGGTQHEVMRAATSTPIARTTKTSAPTTRKSSPIGVRWTAPALGSPPRPRRRTRRCGRR